MPKCINYKRILSYKSPISVEGIDPKDPSRTLTEAEWRDDLFVGLLNELDGHLLNCKENPRDPRSNFTHQCDLRDLTTIECVDR